MSREAEHQTGVLQSLPFRVEVSAVCMDCDLSWEGSEAIRHGRAHSQNHDHQVVTTQVDSYQTVRRRSSGTPLAVYTDHVKKGFTFGDQALLAFLIVAICGSIFGLIYALNWMVS